jgi:hypothetical protein
MRIGFTLAPTEITSVRMADNSPRTEAASERYLAMAHIDLGYINQL